MKNTAALIATLALVAQSPVDLYGEGAPRSHACGARTVVAVTEHFEFHSDPWVNLHHFLHEWARGDRRLPSGRPQVTRLERSTLAQLSPDDRAEWLRAVQFYRDSVVVLNVFQQDMLQLKRELERLGGDPLESPLTPATRLVAVLRVAMPAYCEQWWPPHDQANRTWVAGTASRLRRHESSFVRATMRLYDSQWPAQPWRIDVSAYARRIGYGTMDGHVVVHSTDPANQGLYGLEIVFHEMQHTAAVAGSLPAELARAFESAGLTPPANIGHALIYATAGEVTRSIAVEDGRAEHTPFWIRQDFERLPGWSTLMSAVRSHWLPAVRGEVSSRQGLAALARSVGTR